MNILDIRAQFPILDQQVHGKDLVYLDNAASSQKPISVIQSISEYYNTTHANVHRGVHTLSQQATDQFERTRNTVQKWINASSEQEVIYTRGTTEGINLVAYSYEPFISAGDEIIISHLEHHSNIVPWQMLCERTGAVLKVIPMLKDGSLDMEAYQKLLSDQTAFVSVNHVSNALGTINPVKKIIDLAHQKGAVVLIDGAQSTPHLRVDVQELDADFYVFSSHKIYGPTGMGILFGKKALLDKMRPFHGGGEMIKEVSFEKTTYADLPFKFEAGTPNIADTIALHHAIEFIENVGIENIAAHENDLLQYATEQVQKIGGITLYGTAQNKASVLSFLVDGAHPFDVGSILDKMGIAVRTGHHCTQPIMSYFDIPGTIRASFAVYNTPEEVDKLVEALVLSKNMLL